jgi:NADH:ubiquinone oxidoreductase subunit H
MTSFLTEPFSIRGLEGHYTLQGLITSSVQLWHSLPDFIQMGIYGTIVFAIVAVLGQMAAVVMVLMERKVLAWLTQRQGPNRVGPAGLLQSIADGIKLLFKEDIMTPAQDKFLFCLGPALFLFPVFALYALIPYSKSVLPIALPGGLLVIFALSSLSVLGIVIAGWASNNKFSLMGGMRSAAQAISYEIPLILSLLGVVMFTNTLNLQEIVGHQQGGLLSWFAILLTPLSFLIFYVSSLAEVNRVPFDLPEAESELVSGYNTEYTGMKFATFFLAEYAALFVYSALTALIFFGGYYSPFGGLIVSNLGLDIQLSQLAHLPSLGKLLQEAEMLFWMLTKTYFFIYSAMLIRGTLPRLKPDELMGFSWKFLIPLSLINLVMLAFARFYQLEQSVGYLVAAFLVLVFGVGGFCVWISQQFNRQLKMRFVQS